MKLGIIIICYNNEEGIDVSHCAKYLNKIKDIKICLVNNHSKDNTYEILKELKEDCENVSIVNIKKFKPDSSAVKAGARFMSSQYNLKYLGFVTMHRMQEYENLNRLLKDIKDNKGALLEYNQSFLNKKGIKLTMFQSLFSVIDYLERMQLKSKNSTLYQAG
jgi:glycosyltransferase involved in cell wall biosynthesis